MLPELYDDQRSALMRFSIMLCGASVCFAPFLSGVSFDASAAVAYAPKAWGAVALPGRLAYASVKVARDPFVSEMANATANDTGRSVDAIDAIDVVLPPNTGADGILPAGQSSSILVRAVVLGKQSRALVDMGGNVRVLGIGDVLDGSTIMRIDKFGVALANGERIGLIEAPR